MQNDGRSVAENQREMEGRSWAMIAHLAFFANVWFPFSGFVAVILIYTLR